MNELKQSGDHSVIDETDPPAPKIPAPAIYAPRNTENYQPQEDLVDSRAMRSTIVKALTQGGIPVGDKDQMKHLLATIKDQDAQALGIVRAKIESGAADSIAEMKAAALAMINVAREHRTPPAVIDVASREIPKPSLKDLPAEDLTPFLEGELGTGVSTETFDSFTRKVGGVTLAEEDEEEE